MEGKFTFSRRKFLGLLGASCASAGLVSLAGCSSSESEDGSEEGSSTLADTITFAQSSDPRSLDPAFYDDGESAKVAANIYEGLYRFGTTDTEVEACLATDLPDISDDGLTYVIQLREGVTFHDGTEFNAEAVVRSIERQLEPNRTSDMPYASFVFGEEDAGTGVESVVADSDYQVTITLRSASTPFLKNLAMCLAAPIVSPTALDEYDNNIGEAPCGTGPYKFVSWTKESNIRLEANEDYWDTDNAPLTQNIVFTIVPENNTRVTALINGEADIIDGIDLSSVEQITNNGMELFAEDGMTINYMAFNTDSGVCTDLEVRRAIAQAVNVEELVSTLYGEYATVANSVMPSFMAPFAADIEQTAYDPDAASATLAEKGVTELTCITYSTTRPYNVMGGSQLANLIQGYLSEVGVTLNITEYDWTTYKDRVQNDTFDVCFYGWTGDNGDPDNFMNLLADSNWSLNVARWDNEEYKALIAEGLVTPDGDERDEIYRQCEEMVAEQQPWLLISHSQNLCGYNPNVNDFYYHPTGVVFMKGVSKNA